MEYGFWFMDLAARTHFLVVAELSGKLPKKALEASAHAVQARHPALRSRVTVGPWKQPRFEPCSGPMPIRVASIPPGEGPLTALMEEEIEPPLDTEKGPLFRITAAERGEGWALVLTLHHSIADGICGSRLLLELLSTIEALENGRSPGRAVIPAPGPMERRFPRRFRGATALLRGGAAVLGQAHAKILGKQYDYAPLDARVPAELRKQRFVCRRLDDETTASLVGRVKTAGTTIHGALCAAQLRALAAEIPDSEDPNIPLVSLVDLRRRFEETVDPRAVGVNMSAVKSSHRVGAGRGFWPLAREVIRGLSRGIDRGFHFSYWPPMMRMIHGTRFASSLDARGAASVLRQGGWFEPPASIVSNLGNIVPDPGVLSLGLERLHFLISLSGSGFFACSANGFGGALHLDFTYAFPSLSVERAHRLADRTCAELREAAGDG
jgi:hypothetical protein